MNQEIAHQIAIKARSALDKVADNPNVPGLDTSAVRTATRAVTEQVVPVVENLTNREPWYKSRVILGLGAALIAKGLDGLLGVTVAPGDEVELAGLLLDAVTWAGSVFALYGRLTTKPALGTPT